jgi:catechol-2,3-dioxygenase
MRVSGLLHYGLEIADLEEGRDFYRLFGLDVEERLGTIAVGCAGRHQDQALLVEGEHKRLHHVAFAIAPGTLGEFQRHLESLGIPIEDAPKGLDGDGLWLSDPDGNRINLRERDLAPARAPEPEQLNLPGNYQRVDRAAWLTADRAARPRRLGHVLIFTTDNDAAQRFYTAALGLKLSDRVPGLASFMNAGPGDHHVFGFIQSSHPGLHHSSWEVDTIDQLAIGARTMATGGHEKAWGIGRHTLGSNLFHYIQDPWGSWIEYFADIDQITDDWEPGQEWHAPPWVWSPPIPDDFLVNYEPKE